MCAGFDIDPISSKVFGGGGGGDGKLKGILQRAMAGNPAPAASPIEDAATAEAKGKQAAVKSRLISSRRRRALSLLATAGEGDTALPEVAKPTVLGKQQLGA